MFSKNEISVKIGERIKKIRSEKGISQAELGRKCEKDKQHIELIENHKVCANIYTLYIISQGLEVQLRDLIEF